ncbi:F-box-like protein [Carex littledalei]|uniref:F-box-like protein n=1 Tax=Carex littledalei TaxID=544730 RepID=A0A833VIE9_9POAL|nr:F-box-like protein [Carex littledalei]
MKPREREREDSGHDDVISDGGGCSTPPPPPPALRPPSDVMCKVFSQLDCDDLVSCSLVCKQWYRDSSKLRERRKRKYIAALAFICDHLPRNLVDSFYPRITNELKRRL